MLGRCVVERRVWRDRLASVYLARGREPGEVFTVWAAHSAVIARSERAAHVFGLEMERLTLLEHPGIPQIIAFDAAESGPVVISARRPGSSLREIIASGSDRSPRFAARVLQGLARILEVLHSQSPPVLHRGLIPERVTLDEEGEIHLEECGYLHALVTAGFVTDRTVLGTGQPGYLVPEELAFPATPSLDAFALATLLFELVTGKLPFGEVSAAELSLALRGEHLPMVSHHRDDMMGSVDSVFERAFGVARGEGYPTVQAFARDLLRALDPDVSTRLTVPGPDPHAAEGEGANLSIAIDPEPTPSYGDYGAMLARFDARRSGAEPMPDERELASDDPSAVTPRVARPGPSVLSVPRAELPAHAAPLGSSKRTLPGGSFALPPNALGRVSPPSLGQSALRTGPTRPSPREPDPDASISLVDLSADLESDVVSVQLPSSALQTIDDDAIALSSRDLQPLANAVRDAAGGSVPHDIALLADQPTQVSPAPAPRPLARVSLTPPSGRPLSRPAPASSRPQRPTPAPRAPSSSPPARSTPSPRAPSPAPPMRAPSTTPPARVASAPPASAPPRHSYPSDVPSRLPAPARIPSDLAHAPSSLPPDASQVFAQSARVLAVSTVIAAVCVTTGLLYIARSSDELAAALRAQGAASPSAPAPALVIPSPTPAVDAGSAPIAVPTPSFDAGAPSVVSVDAGASPDVPRAVAAPTPVDAGSPTVAVRPVGLGPVPGAPTVARLIAALRAPVADCVEGVEARSVTMVPRFDGATGAVVHLRLRGIFSEPPMAPCLDEAVRRVRIAPFGAPTWEPSLTFPIAAPRWTPNPNNSQ